MATRTERTIVSFKKPFSLPGIEGVQPAGDYIIETDDELIEGISRLAYRRVATLLHLPSTSSSKYTRQLVPVRQQDLDAVLQQDQGIQDTD